MSFDNIRASKRMADAAKVVTIWSPWWAQLLPKADFVYRGTPGSRIMGMSDMVFISDRDFINQQSVMDVAVALEYACQQSIRRVDSRSSKILSARPHVPESLVALSFSLEINSDIRDKFERIDPVDWDFKISTVFDKSFKGYYDVELPPTMYEGAMFPEDFGFEKGLTAEKYLNLLVEMKNEEEREALENPPEEDSGEEEQEGPREQAEESTPEQPTTEEDHSPEQDGGGDSSDEDSIATEDESSKDESGSEGDEHGSEGDGVSSRESVDEDEDSGGGEQESPESEDGEGVVEEEEKNTSGDDLPSQYAEDSDTAQSDGNPNSTQEGEESSSTPENSAGEGTEPVSNDSGTSTPEEDENSAEGESSVDDDASSNIEDFMGSESHSDHSTDDVSIASGLDDSTQGGEEVGEVEVPTMENGGDIPLTVGDVEQHSSSDSNVNYQLSIPSRPDDMDITGASEDEQEDILKEIAQDIKDIEEGNFDDVSPPLRGTIDKSDDFSKWARGKLHNPKASWKKMLAKAINSEMGAIQMSGQTDMTYGKANPNQKEDMPLMMGFTTYPPEVTIVIDASPSMKSYKDTAMREFMGAVRTIFSKYGSPITVAVADSGIRYAKQTNTPRSVLSQVSRTYSSSSFDFGQTLKKISKNGVVYKKRNFKKPDILIVFTDCAFNWYNESSSRLPRSYPYTIIVSVHDYDKVVRNLARVGSPLPKWVKKGKNFVYVD